MKQHLLPAAGLLMSLLFGSCTREAQGKTSFPAVISFSSFPNGKTEIEYAERGQQHKVEFQGSKITALFIDGKKIPQENYAMHKATGETILQQIEAGRQKMEAGLTPPKAKGPEAGKARIEVVNLLPGQ